MKSFDHRFWLTSTCLFAILFCGLSAPLSAAAVLPDTVYRLLDHPDGALTKMAPFYKYGLRYDHAPDGMMGTIQRVFSFELGTADVRALWTPDPSADPKDDTLRIWGKVYEQSTDGPHGDIWTLEFTAEKCFAVAGPGLGGVDCEDAVPGTGLGTVTHDGGTKPTITLFAKGAGANTFRFVGDGHRLAGDDESEVGRGWVNPAGTACCDDFLFRAKVPEPSSLLLLGSGLVGAIVLLRRRFRD